MRKSIFIPDNATDNKKTNKELAHQVGEVLEDHKIIQIERVEGTGPGWKITYEE